MPNLLLGYRLGRSAPAWPLRRRCYRSSTSLPSCPVRDLRINFCSDDRKNSNFLMCLNRKCQKFFNLFVHTIKVTFFLFLVESNFFNVHNCSIFFLNFSFSYRIFVSFRSFNFFVFSKIFTKILNGYSLMPKTFPFAYIGPLINL